MDFFGKGQILLPLRIDNIMLGQRETGFGFSQTDVDKVNFTFTELIDGDDGAGIITDDRFGSSKTAQCDKRLSLCVLCSFRFEHVLKHFRNFTAIGPGLIFDFNFSGDGNELGRTKKFAHVLTFYFGL